MDKYMKKSDVIAYIRNEAKEAQSAFEELGGESGIIAEAFEDLANELEDFPATDVAPVQPGFWDCVDSSYWRWTPSGGVPVSRLSYRCSRCGRGTAIKSNYCPNCGAKMDGAE